MDVRRNFAALSPAERGRVIEAIKWMKKNERTGVDGATVEKDRTDGGLYQRYVNFHSQGQVEANLSDFTVTLPPAPKDTLHSIVIDKEEWVSPTRYPVSATGLADFFYALPITPGGVDIANSPFNVTEVTTLTPAPTLMGKIKNSPFGEITLRVLADGATVPTDKLFALTPTGAKYVLDTYRMAHRSPAFLPWHRVMLRMFEKDLQFADKKRGNDGKITLPFWTFSRDNDWNETSKSSVWHRENFGGFSNTPEGTVTGNHFAPGPAWELFNTARTKLTGIDGQLRRRRIADRGGPPSSTLPLAPRTFPTTEAAQSVIAIAEYLGANRGGFGGNNGSGGNHRFAGRLEHRLHDPLHGLVGGQANPPSRTQAGQMSDALFSPQDPIFWLFHCNVDRLWSRWQLHYDTNNDSRYPTFGMLPGRRRGDALQPWAATTPEPPYKINVRIQDVLNAANFSSAVNADNLLGKGYKYDDLSV